MAITWGSMNRQDLDAALADAQADCAIDRECFDRAKAEINALNGTGPKNPLVWSRAVIDRAQKLKAEIRGKK